jgi:hypothetical protein
VIVYNARNAIIYNAGCLPFGAPVAVKELKAIRIKLAPKNQYEINGVRWWRIVKSQALRARSGSRWR